MPPHISLNVICVISSVILQGCCSKECNTSICHNIGNKYIYIGKSTYIHKKHSSVNKTEQCVGRDEEATGKYLSTTYNGVLRHIYNYDIKFEKTLKVGR